MRTMNFNMKLNPKLLLVGLLITAGVSTYVVKMKDARAVSSTPSGQCGALINITPQNISPVAANQGYGASALMYVDFSNLRITARATVQEFPSDYNTPSVSSKFPTYITNTVTSTFLLSAGTVPNTYVITTPNGADIPSFSVMPVNGGNTYLLQAENDRGFGVCQMI